MSFAGARSGFASGPWQSFRHPAHAFGRGLQGFHDFAYLVRVSHQRFKCFLYGLQAGGKQAPHFRDVGVDPIDRLSLALNLLMDPVNAAAERLKLGNEAFAKMLELLVGAGEGPAQSVEIVAHRLDGRSHTGHLVAQRLNRHQSAVQPVTQGRHPVLELPGESTDGHPGVSHPP